MVDIDSDKWTQYAGASKGVLRMIYNREARTLLRLEREATQIFPSTLLVSSFEAATMASLAPESRAKIHTARNGVDTVHFSPDFPCKNPLVSTEIPIVMTGRMDYRPNHEGAIWFAKEVLPLVRGSLPGARFYAVGAKPPQQLCALRGDGVVVTGSVDDIRPYLRHAAIVVAPLHMARGVQNKVLEAMAMQKRVVATTPATRALDVRSGRELWIANAPAEFAAAIIAALGNADSEQIARNGRQHVENDYAWERNLAIFDGLIDGLADGVRLPSGWAASTLSVPRDMQTSAGVQ
jgi:sugar transferase (PEP-CTERM/EpsH1 system associated)